MLAFVKALSKEEHKRNLDADAKLATLASKLSEDILDGVILESLNTLSVEKEKRHSVEKANMMEIDGEPMHEYVIVESIQAHI